jgi:outer membrane protein W
MEVIMNRKAIWAVLVMFGILGVTTSASAENMLRNYLALKGGIYAPSATFDLANTGVGTTFDGDTETGFSGEIAFGHHFSPTFALEVGIGYLQGKGTFATGTSRANLDFDVIPVILTAKAFIPVGPVKPYGAAGIGAYFSEFNVENNLNSFEGKTTFGIHAGAGLNVEISRKAFIGVEMKYIWAEPSFGGQEIRLNDEDYDLTGFDLNGFTTTLALGFRF